MTYRFLQTVRLHDKDADVVYELYPPDYDDLIIKSSDGDQSITLPQKVAVALAKEIIRVYGE
jgi:hypothetical protein